MQTSPLNFGVENKTALRNGETQRRRKGNRAKIGENGIRFAKEYKSVDLNNHNLNN